MYIQDTIAAISTPLGEGGIGIIRVSGPEAEGIAAGIFKTNTDGGFISHRFYYGTIVDPGQDIIVDEAMLVIMRGPRSYTREDVIELHCHGGYLVVQRLLDLVLSSGARLAEPGEFTKRAFLNGRIDLLQAESVIDIIRSKTDRSLALAQRQREGLLSKRINAVADNVKHALALVEAHIDFPEDEVGPVAFSEIGQLVMQSLKDISQLLAGFTEGKTLREGVSVVIAGKPNVGKSSLLNVLLQEKRAIVTSVPGTTRDVIEEVINFDGLPVRMLDTAGIRLTDDIVEREGVRLTLEKIPQADLVLFLVDGSRPFDDNDLMILRAIGAARMLIVKNKADLRQCLLLPLELAGYCPVAISTLTGEGIDVLRCTIRDAFLRDGALDSREFVAVSQVRHRDALAKSELLIQQFLTSYKAGVELAILAWELREALDALGTVTGKNTPDDLLDLIFSRFCVGK